MKKIVLIAAFLLASYVGHSQVYRIETVGESKQFVITDTVSGVRERPYLNREVLADTTSNGNIKIFRQLTSDDLIPIGFPSPKGHPYTAFIDGNNSDATFASAAAVDTWFKDNTGFNTAGGAASSTDLVTTGNNIVINPDRYTIGTGKGIVFIGDYDTEALRNRLPGNQDLRTIIGGYDNEIEGGASSQGVASAILGSHHSSITGATSNHGTIAGGSYNAIEAGAYNAIFGGTINTINGTAGNGSGIFAGNNNQVSSNSAIVLGGGSNVVSGNTASNTSGQGNTVSGNLAANVGGETIVVSGLNSANLAGKLNTVSGQFSGIISGLSNSNAGQYSGISGGRENTITSGAEYISVTGGRGNVVSAASKYSRVSGLEASATVQGADYLSNGKITTVGDAQTFVVPLKISTTDATAKPIRPSDFVTVAIPSNKSWVVRALVIGTDGTDTASFEVKGCVMNIAGTTSIKGTPTVTGLGNSAGASTWNVSLTLNSTELRINAIGEAAKTIKWSARLEVSEIGF